MKSFPKTIYVTRTEPEEDDYVEFFVHSDKSFIDEEEIDAEVAVYKLVKTGSVARKSTIQFE